MAGFRETVVSIVQRGKYARIAEVGVWKGSLSRMLWRLPFVRSLILVDPMDAHTIIDSGGKIAEQLKMMPDAQSFMDRLYAQIVKEKPRTVEMHRMTSVEAASRVPDGSLDFVFIDAIHTYESVRQDIRIWSPKLKPGGVLAGDDMQERFPGVQQAVEETFGSDYRREGKEGRIWHTRISSPARDPDRSERPAEAEEPADEDKSSEGDVQTGESADDQDPDACPYCDKPKSKFKTEHGFRTHVRSCEAKATTQESAEDEDDDRL